MLGKGKGENRINSEVDKVPSSLQYSVFCN